MASSRIEVVELNPLQHTHGGRDELTGLETLWLEHTQVTKPGVRKLQDALPKCRIYAP